MCICACPPETHNECREGRCTSVIGTGSDACYTDADCMGPQGKTNLYIDPNPANQGTTLTIIATGTTSCSTYIYDPPQSGGGYTN
ncbi:MAG: hypothetical protein ACOZBZ_02745, partial [Patescibacteria group bacterium]